MEGQSSDAEVIKVIIVDDDGNETEVDANCIKLEISNTEDFESLEGIWLRDTFLITPTPVIIFLFQMIYQMKMKLPGKKQNY